MNLKTWVPLILAAVLRLIAARAGRSIIVRAQRAGLAEGKRVAIVAAKNDLGPGVALSEADVVLVPLPSDRVPRNALRNVSDVAGRVVIMPVVQGQAILESTLAPAGSSAGLAALIPPGMRAISIDVSESSGVAGLLVPGSHVDVVCTLQDEKLNQQIARTIVENAKVIAVGQRVTPPSRKDEEEAGRAKSVTLAAAPREVEAIELAGSTGKMRLVLRGSLDDAKVQTRGMTVAELLGGQRKQAEPVAYVAPPTTRPAPVDVPVHVKPAPYRTVEVIRNGVPTLVQIPTTAPPNGALTGDSGGAAPVIPDRSP